MILPEHIHARLGTDDTWPDAEMMDVLHYLKTSSKLQLPEAWDYDLGSIQAVSLATLPKVAGAEVARKSRKVARKTRKVAHPKKCLQLSKKIRGLC